MSLRSPLGKVLGTGSAKEGTDHFWAQRVSAAALAVLGVWFACSLVTGIGATREAVAAWIAAPWHGVPLLLLVVTLAWHSSLGVQVVIEDYVHGPFTKVLSLVLSRFAHVVVGASGVFAILAIAFGG